MLSDTWNREELSTARGTTTSAAIHGTLPSKKGQTLIFGSICYPFSHESARETFRSLVLDARLAGEVLERSIAGQVEYWAKLGPSCRAIDSGAEYTLDLDANTWRRDGSSGYQIRTADGVFTWCSQVVIGETVTIHAGESLGFPGGSRVIVTTPEQGRGESEQGQTRYFVAKDYLFLGACNQNSARSLSDRELCH